MIPVKLSVRNFMCYRGDSVTLDLSGVRLACLSGENGAGKSALLGAITWALWGKARERVSDDDLISQGASEMEVEYEFILSETAYRVVRKRSRKGSAGTTILEMHMLAGEEALVGIGAASADDGRRTTDDGGHSAFRIPHSALGTWRPMTGHNVRDTQARITELLKMEYDTFINSAYILQGRADEFTIKAPADRKKVLADILGLDDYDRLEDLAKEKAKWRKEEINNLDGQMDNVNRELLRRPEYAQSLEAVEAQLIERQEELVSAKDEFAGLETRWKELQTHTKRLEELRGRANELKVELESVQSRIYANNARKADLEALLARRKDIERGYADWQGAQADAQRFVDNLSVLRALEAEGSQHDKTISGERIRLDSEKGNAERDAQKLESNLAGRSVLERQLAEAMDKVRTLTNLKTRHEETTSQYNDLEARWQVLDGLLKSLVDEGTTLREKQKMILKAHADGKGHANCPVCASPLDAEALDRVQRSYQEDIDKKLELHALKLKEQRAIEKARDEASRAIEQQKVQLKQLPVQQEQEVIYKQKISLLDKDQEQLDKARARIKTLLAQLESEDYAQDARRALGEVAAKMAKVDYSKEKHDAASQKVAELQTYNEQYHKLEGAEHSLALVQDSLKTDNATLASLEKEREKDEAEIAVIRSQIDDSGHGSPVEEIGALLQIKKGDVSRLDGEVVDLHNRRGDLRGKLERCDELQVEKGRLMVRYDVAVEEKGIYDELTLAFGKKGIQAMIIENIIPELEDEANALLTRMTDGRMNVHFATQRDARSTKGGVIETLDINISDEIGTRSYELYSGGEAFRVNFAVRIALSKLLARRAGAQLQLLVIDEGFGTQDGQGRDRLVSAIRSIQDDFEKILVVTHIEELKGEFPVRIEVIKTESGSLINMN